MPLTDLVRTLNSRSLASLADWHPDTSFIAAGRRAFLHYAGLRLESGFLPWIDVATGQLWGHAGIITASRLGTGQRCGPGEVFALAAGRSQLGHLDRLIRTLHVLNYLTQPVRRTLLLKVYRQSGDGVRPEQGLAFEDVLQPCGLLPEQIVLEIEAGDRENTGRLRQAVACCRSRNYGVVASCAGRGGIDFDQVRELRPDIVKLDPVRLGSWRSLPAMTGIVHALGARILVEGSDSPSLRRQAVEAGIDFLLARGGTVAPPPSPPNRNGRRGSFSFQR